MAAGVVEKLLKTLSSFNPRTFASDQEAGNYVHGLARSNRHLTNRGPAIERFLKGYSSVNADLRAGKPNADAAAIDKGMSPLPDDLILSRVVGPEAFGLNPQNIGQVEELTGKLISDKGYSSTSVGTPLQHGAGQITMSIAAPKGTRALAPSTGTATREVILGRDQPYRITKVDPDGQGGFYVYAVASGDSEGEKPVDIGKAIPGNGVQEQGGEVSPGPEVGTGGVGTGVAGRTGRPPGPGPGDRNEGHIGTVGTGKAPAGEVTGETPPELPPKPEEGADTRNTFRTAFEEANLKMPTVGNRRKEFTDAYFGIASGKKTPQEAVNDLDNAIAVNKRILASDKEDGTDSGPLAEDIKRQEALSDLIKEHFNFTGRKPMKQEPEKKAVPEKKTGGGIAGDLKKLDEEIGRQKLVAKTETERNARVDTGPEDVVGKWLEASGVRDADLSSADKAELKAVAGQVLRGKMSREEAKIRLGESSSRRLKVISGHVEGVEINRKSRTRVTKKAAPEKKTTPVKKAAPEKETPKRLIPGMAAGKTNAGRVQVGEKILVDKNRDGEWVPATRKTGVTTLTVTGKSAATGRGRSRIVIHGEDENGNKVDVRSAPSHQTFWLVSEKGAPAKRTPAKKAAPEVKQAPGDLDKMTIPQLREEARRQDKKIPSSARRKADILAFLKGEKAPEPPEKKTRKQELGATGLDTMTIPELRKTAQENNIKIPASIRRKADIVDYLKNPAAREKVPVKKAVPEVKAPEVKTPEAPTKPQWGTIKALGIKSGDIVTYHGDDRRGGPKAEDRRVRVEYRNGLVHLVDPETGKTLQAFGAAHRGWFRSDTKGAEVPVRKTLSTKELKRESTVTELRDLRARLDKIPLAKQRELGLPALTETVDRWISDVNNGDMQPAQVEQALSSLGGVRYGTSNDPDTKRISRELIDTLDRIRGVEAKTPEGPDITKMTVAQLKDEAKKRGIDIPSLVRSKADIQAMLRGERSETLLKARRRQADKRQEAAGERIRIREQERNEKAIAKEARMRLAGEKKAAREREVQARKDQREAARNERIAKLEQERIAKQQEREAERARKAAEREAEKKAAAQRRKEEELKRKLEKVEDYDTLTGERWTISMLRSYAQGEGIKIPSDLRFRSEIREYVIKARNRKRADRIAASKTRRELFDIMERDGIEIPAMLKLSGSPEQVARYIEEQRQIVADMGIDPAKFKPKDFFVGTMSGISNTDPNAPLKIRDYYRPDGYKVTYGVAVRRNNVSYLIETETARQASSPYHVARMVKELEDFHNSLPNGSKYQHTYGWNLGRSPGDKYWAEKFKNPKHRAIASAGGGNVDVWDQKYWDKTPAQLADSLNHEFGHNVDGHGKGHHGDSRSPEWADAARRDWEHAQRDARFAHLAMIPPKGLGHMTTVSDDPDRAWQYGVSNYGKSSSGEDFAESLSQYMSMQPLARNSRGEFLYFWDLFPQRAAYLERLLPELLRRRREIEARARA